MQYHIHAGTAPYSRLHNPGEQSHWQTYDDILETVLRDIASRYL